MICRRGPNVVLVWLISVSAMILFISADCRAERSSKGSKVIEAGAEEIAEIIENQYEAGGIDRIRQELERHTDGESMELFGGYDAGRLIDDLVRGTVDMDLKGIGARTLKIFSGSFTRT